MTPVFVATAEIQADERLLGGKGAALQTLRAHGVPVPPFAVVTTDAFRHGREPPDDGLISSILEAASNVAGDVGCLAVRSSATVEDRPGASFAGQFRSVLNVAVPHEVMAAVHEVWQSLSSPAAQTYRAHQQATAGDPAMAVVLMRQIAARRSGVVFTRDPVGDRDAVRVETVDGTADRLVSGAVTPEVVRVARGASDVSDPVIAEVVRLALRCEEIFGEPQDVEWVWDGEQVLVVQSRPITAMSSTTTSAGIGEMLPGVLAPLVADTAVTAVDHAVTALVHRLGALPPSLTARGGMVVYTEQRAALRLDLLGRPRVAHDLRVVRLRRRTATDGDIVTAAVDALMDDPPSASVDTLGSEDLWRRCRRVYDLFLRTVETEVATAALAAAAFDRLVAFLTPYATDDAAPLALELTRTGVSSPMVMRWRELAERWRGRPSGRRLLGEDSWDEVLATLDGDDPEIGALRDDLLGTVRRAGSRAVPGGPTWDDDLAAAWAAIRAASRFTGHSLGTTDTTGSVCDRLTNTARWRRRRLLTGWVIDSQTITLRRHRREATALLNARERLKDTVMCLGGELHRLHHRLGEALRREGRLAVDVDTLSMADLDTLVSGRMLTAAHPEVLVGWAASGGTYEGCARVIQAADDPFEPGEILVAHTTDPSWSPIFMAAGALVVEQGGLLSHAAVIARELGLPAVVNVPGVTARVTTGMRLRVDGGTGKVTVVGEVSHGQAS